MATTDYVHVSYIRTTPAKVWEALVEPKVTKRYWHLVNLSDWAPGSRWEHRTARRGGRLMLAGTVRAADPPRRLVLTWAFPKDERRPARQTRVAFRIEPVRGIVRLTVRHDRLAAGSPMHRGITEGWPKVLSSLKSMLETGKPLPKLW